MNKYSVKLLNEGLIVRKKSKKKRIHNTGYKLTNDELTKWTRILGPKKIMALYMDSKIQLSTNQLNRIIKKKNDETETDVKNKPVTKDDFDKALDVIIATMQINMQKNEEEN